MATDADRLKTITDNIERLYQELRRAAGAIAGLLQVGQATCAQVRAYNLWAIATYNTQRGMLATLRANGETGVPELPPSPTYFAWKGVSGEAAWRIDCGAQGVNGLAGPPRDLHRALRDAMKPAKSAQRLSTNEIQIITSDPFVLDPERAPSFAALFEAQTARAQSVEGLGVPPAVIIVIATVIMITVSVAIPAIMRFLETSAIQESNSKQVASQAAAYANYVTAILECYKTCTGQGGRTDACVETCAKLVDKPKITLPGQGKPWGWLQWTGFTVVAGVGGLVAWRVVQRRAQGRPIFELPSPP